MAHSRPLIKTHARPISLKKNPTEAVQRTCAVDSSTVAMTEWPRGMLSTSALSPFLGRVARDANFRCNSLGSGGKMTLGSWPGQQRRE